MTRTEKVTQLRRVIASRLDSLIDRDFALLGLPYYLNVGDILIWEGEREYLSASRHKCLNVGYHYRERHRIQDDTLILLQGGGNFGDLWRFIQDERIDIIRRFSRNPIVILPVTCWYEDKTLMARDADALSCHPNLTICARDEASYDLLARNFKNRILLVPDMAFYIDPASLEKYRRTCGEGTLYVKRTDQELAVHNLDERFQAIPGATVADWPSIEKKPLHWVMYEKLYGWGCTAERRRGIWRVASTLIKLSDLFYQHIGRRCLIKQGASFVGQYRVIYTTRLHVAILAILLDREVHIIDNTYGKNSSFYKTWLQDVDGVHWVN